MTKERCRELLDENIGDMYWDEEKHELTENELDWLAEFFSKCELGRELSCGSRWINIKYEYKRIVFMCGSSHRALEMAERKVEKINSRGYSAVQAIELGSYCVEVNAKELFTN